MALEIWFKDDVAQGILSITVAQLTASIASGPNVEYCRGIVDTARAHALNYGIPWPGLAGELHEALGDAGRGEVLGLVAGALPISSNRN